MSASPADILDAIHRLDGHIRSRPAGSPPRVSGRQPCGAAAVDPTAYLVDLA